MRALIRRATAGVAGAVALVGLVALTSACAKSGAGPAAAVHAVAEQRAPAPGVGKRTFGKLAKARERIEEGRYDKAIELLEKHLRKRRYHGNERAQMHDLLARAHHELGLVDRAIHHYEQVLAQLPDISVGMEAMTMHRLSQLFFREGNKRRGEAATSWYWKALAKSQEWLAITADPAPEEHYRIAQIHYQMGDFPRATESMELAVRLTRERDLRVRPEWWTMLQYLYFEQENWPKVMEIVDVLAEEYPDQVNRVSLESVADSVGDVGKRLWRVEAEGASAPYSVLWRPADAAAERSRGAGGQRWVLDYDGGFVQTGEAGSGPARDSGATLGVAIPQARVEVAETLDSEGEILPVVRVEPRYPSWARKRGIEGYVVVEFVVTEEGKVRHPVVIDSSPRRVFDEAAIDAASKFRYKPKIVDGRPAEAFGVRNKFVFDLRNQG